MTIPLCDFNSFVVDEGVNKFRFVNNPSPPICRVPAYSPLNSYNIYLRCHR